LFLLDLDFLDIATLAVVIRRVDDLAFVSQARENAFPVIKKAGRSFCHATSMQDATAI